MKLLDQYPFDQCPDDYIQECESERDWKVEDAKKLEECRALRESKRLDYVDEAMYWAWEKMNA